MNTVTMIIIAVLSFFTGGVFGVLIMACANVAGAADREENTDHINVNVPVELSVQAPKAEMVITEEEIRAHPHYAKNYEAFMQKYHPEVLEDPCTKWTSDIYDEYIAWCQSPEGRPYFED